MATKTFTMVKARANAVKTTAEVKSLLKELENLTNPYNNQGRCPFKNEQPVTEFIGIMPMKWDNTEKQGHSLALEFKGLAQVAISNFFKTSEDAIDEKGEFKHVENPNEGLAKIFGSYSSLEDDALWDEVIKFFDAPRKFQITTFIVPMPWGRQQRHLINII